MAQDVSRRRVLQQGIEQVFERDVLMPPLDGFVDGHAQRRL
jgi:hypothetical protein